MGKPATKKPAAKPAAKPEAEFTTDAPRQGPLGERQPPTEADLIAEAAKDHKPGGDLEDA